MQVLHAYRRKEFGDEVGRSPPCKNTCYLMKIKVALDLQWAEEVGFGSLDSSVQERNTSVS